MFKVKLIDFPYTRGSDVRMAGVPSFLNIFVCVEVHRFSREVRKGTQKVPNVYNKLRLF